MNFIPYQNLFISCLIGSVTLIYFADLFKFNVKGKLNIRTSGNRYD